MYIYINKTVTTVECIKSCLLEPIDHSFIILSIKFQTYLKLSTYLAVAINLDTKVVLLG